MSFTSCTICLDTINDHPAVVLTGCGHVFHERCLNRAYETRRSCPICRLPIGSQNVMLRLFLSTEERATQAERDNSNVFNNASKERGRSYSSPSDRSLARSSTSILSDLEHHVGYELAAEIEQLTSSAASCRRVCEEFLKLKNKFKVLQRLNEELEASNGQKDRDLRNRNRRIAELEEENIRISRKLAKTEAKFEKMRRAFQEFDSESDVQEADESESESDLDEVNTRLRNVFRYC
uniref:RING-type domain-containing protein n=1 Tax=Steinernema glaseri TaxID=37863 RepID=A0A1I7YB49_9BILA